MTGDNMGEVEQFLTVEEAAKIYKTSTKSITRRIKEGRLPASKQRGKTVILKSSLENYFDSTTNYMAREINNVSFLTEYPINLFNSAIYFLLDDKEVIYIGQSTQLSVRLHRHGHKLFHRVFYFPVHDKRLLLPLEKALITLFRPKLNKVSIKAKISKAEQQLLNKHFFSLKNQAGITNG